VAKAEAENTKVVRKLQFLNNFLIKTAVLQAESRQTEGLQTARLASDFSPREPTGFPNKSIALKHEQTAIPIEVEFRNVKTLRLTVYPPDGRVKVISPIGTSREDIRKFAESKIAWIKKHREKFLNHSNWSSP
jgi:hypothetical protein